ncbi:MAG TPA: Xaa-Pro aminopeptidase [Pyrinomonadaceae bacterium]|nr:Xaa-Pro aminopeptidase [Pyrinomonadaceae bacterium]
MKRRKRILPVGILSLGLITLVLPVVLANANYDGAPAPVVHVTPPAPIFEDAKRLGELAARRKQVADAIGPKAMLVMFSAEPRVYTNDVDFPFRQENNLFYLTNLNQKGATLVMMPGTQLPEVLFLPRRNPAAETWTGHMYSAEEAAGLSGIKEIWAASELDPFMKAIRNKEAYVPKPENILMTARTGSLSNSELNPLLKAIENQDATLCLIAAPERGESREYRQEQRFANDWRTVSGITLKPVGPIFAAMRAKKSAMELALLQHAIDISIEAHERAWIAAGSAKWEYEIDSEVARIFKLRNADNWGYPDIVGCGANATTLHYEESQAQCKPGDLLLMDVGAEYGHYSADVTRTTPVNGKFSPAQAAIYQIVYDAQEAAAKAAKPGANLTDAHRASLDVIKAGLLKLGLITDVNSDQYRMWFMHGNGHWLGMNVHDVSAGARFEPGMTFTNEPGIYIRPDALDNLPQTPQNAQLIAAIKPAFEKYRGIGVRIEDDMLITPEGSKWMTAALPRSIADIEAFIARARREQRSPAGM